MMIREDCDCIKSVTLLMVTCTLTDLGELDDSAGKTLVSLDRRHVSLVFLILILFVTRSLNSCSEVCDVTVFFFYQTITLSLVEWILMETRKRRMKKLIK